ncbi:MAG: hypothetical protein QNI84_12345 [Henriciella sp.]|nr:hypothetical protein [Henriciella sp.]
MSQFRSIKAILAISVIIGLAACATPTPYRALEDGYGYSEEKLDDDRYRVSFHGNADTSQTLANDYLMLRMADLTLENRKAYFTVEEQGTDCFITIRTSPDSTCTVHRAYTNPYPYYEFETERRGLFQTGPKREYDAIAFFRMTDEAPDAVSTTTFSAEDVTQQLQHLRP